MTTIDILDLALVTGGKGDVNRQTVTSSDGTKVETQRSNYAYCVDTVKTACDAANPGFLHLWTDTQGSAQCQLKYTEPTCGKPPTP